VEAGDKLGKYQILSRLARGGMAEVWLARFQGVGGFEKDVVLKTILPDLSEDPDFVRMFINEALLAANLNHPNIVQIFDLGCLEGMYFIAMEYVPGKSLRQIARRLRSQSELLPPWFLLRVVVAVCDGLQYAHDYRDTDGQPLHLVHRDISPENILVSFTGTVKILDFGIAKATTEASLTRAGMLKGKYSYISPEQVRGLPASPRSDLYAVGVVLYELLSGARPFVATGDLELLRQVVEGKPAPLAEIAPWVPVELHPIVSRALANDPGNRYAEASDLSGDLLAYLQASHSVQRQRDLVVYLAGLFADEPGVPSDVLRSLGSAPAFSSSLGSQPGGSLANGEAVSVDAKLPGLESTPKSLKNLLHDGATTPRSDQEQTTPYRDDPRKLDQAAPSAEAKPTEVTTSPAAKPAAPSTKPAAKTAPPATKPAAKTAPPATTPVAKPAAPSSKSVAKSAAPGSTAKPAAPAPAKPTAAPAAVPAAAPPTAEAAATTKKAPTLLARPRTKPTAPPPAPRPQLAATEAKPAPAAPATEERPAGPAPAAVTGAPPAASKTPAPTLAKPRSLAKKPSPAAPEKPAPAAPEKPSLSAPEKPVPSAGAVKEPPVPTLPPTLELPKETPRGEPDLPSPSGIPTHAGRPPIPTPNFFSVKRPLVDAGDEGDVFTSFRAARTQQATSEEEENLRKVREVNQAARGWLAETGRARPASADARPSGLDEGRTAGAWDRVARPTASRSAPVSTSKPAAGTTPVGKQVAATVHFENGLTSLREGRHAEALAAWTAAIELDPGNRLYQSNLRRLKKMLEKA
jgi:serine/threonine protein kinase